MGLQRKILGITASSLLALAIVVGVQSPVGATPVNGTCQSQSLAMALGAGLPASTTISGTLCTPSTWAEGAHQLDVLVHGATYNRAYWDWPVDPATYSYVDKTLQAGRATFAYDRISTGLSTNQPSAVVTINADAYVLHQIVQHYRAAPASYPEVNVVGHSFGSMVAIAEAAAYHDVDRVVVTGLLHSVGPVYINAPSNLYPAFLDPQFAGLLDVGYLTTTPGQRGTLFYNATGNSAVIAYDEAHKDKVSGVQAADGLARTYQPLVALNESQNITAPVLSVVGDQDQLFCGLLLSCTSASVQAAEAPYYGNAASFNTAVIANTAHDLALHPSAPTSFTTINQWMTTH